MADGRHFKPGATSSSEEVVGTLDARPSVGASSPRPPRRRMPKRSLLVTLALALAVAGVGGVVAWITSQSMLSNQFGLAEVGPVVEETFDGNIKSSVKVKNDGDVPIYVRVQVNCYYQDEGGNQVWDKPEVSVDRPDDTSLWAKDDDASEPNGTYYYTQPLEPDVSTPNLFDSIALLGDAKDGLTFVCDITAQGIQADPTAAVKEAWGVDVDQNGALIITDGAAQGGE